VVGEVNGDNGRHPYMAKKRSLTPTQSLDQEKEQLIPPVLPEGKLCWVL